ncbi:hypothetical protein KW805_01225 [Candidatus Pacearchaeota archaeon]|nr:hypothetical protein [Candidatus Pacearchaeota archaeon]
MKALIFDSGPIINLAMNGLLSVLRDLKKSFDGKFIITQAVKYEIIDRPVGVSRFELEALMVKSLFDSGVLEMPSEFGVDEEELKKATQKLMESANHYVQIKEKWIPIVSEAEMSCLALSSALTKKGITNLIAIDERTTRILSENPENLEKLLSDRMHERATIIRKDISLFSGYRFIRSSEIVYVAYKKGLIPLQGKKVLEALLYATKFKGAAISFEEIDQLKKL